MAIPVNLTIRNLGFSGDELGGYTDKPEFDKRLRSLDFGTADQWLAGEPIEKRLELLKHPEDRVRYRAKVAWGARDPDSVMIARKEWMRNLANGWRKPAGLGERLA